MNKIGPRPKLKFYGQDKTNTTTKIQSPKTKRVQYHKKTEIKFYLKNKTNITTTKFKVNKAQARTKTSQETQK